MNPPLLTTLSESSNNPAMRPASRVLWAGIGYCILSSLTLPFVGRVWLGELPVLALIQLPKIVPADWLRTHVVMKVIKFFGMSRGSFSPDYVLARPYALALVYLVLVVIVGVVGFRYTQSRKQGAVVTLAFVGAAALDYVFTLVFADSRSLALY